MCAPPLLSLPSEFQMISVTFPSATSILPWKAPGGYWGPYPAGKCVPGWGASVCMPAVQGERYMHVSLNEMCIGKSSTQCQDGVPCRTETALSSWPGKELTWRRLLIQSHYENWFIWLKEWNVYYVFGI